MYHGTQEKARFRPYRIEKVLLYLQIKCYDIDLCTQYYILNHLIGEIALEYSSSYSPELF